MLFIFILHYVTILVAWIEVICVYKDRDKEVRKNPGLRDGSFEVFELYAMLDNYENGGKLIGTAEKLGLKPAEVEDIYRNAAGASLDRLNTFIKFMGDFGIVESKRLIELARDADGSVEPRSLTLLFLDALYVYNEGFSTAEMITSKTIDAFANLNLKGAGIIKDYKRYEDMLIKQSEKELGNGFVRGVDGTYKNPGDLIAKVRRSMDDITGKLFKNAIPLFYETKEMIKKKTDYFG